MKITFFWRLLSANTLSSAIGIAIQAATAPVFLLVLSVDQYATILLAQTVASYFTFLLNGFFYFIMNSVTSDSINKRIDQAAQTYALGYFSIGILAIFATIGLGLTIAIVGDMRNTTVLIWIAVLGSIVNFSYIMVDANFRVRNQYTLGVNILTVARVSDFVFLAGALVVTGSTYLSLLFNLFTRLMTIIFIKWLAERHPEATWIGTHPPNLQQSINALISARGQLGLSAYTALATIGPQLVVSSFFQNEIAVTFNVHRTYMRAVAAIVNVVTASSWPIVNNLHATNRTSDLAEFLRKLIIRSMFVTFITSLVLAFVAPLLFPTLFHGKVTVNVWYLVTIGLACIFNGATVIGQMLYLATNLRSVFVLIAFLLTIVELMLMALVGLRVGFEYGLSVYALFELFVMVSAIIGCFRTLSFGMLPPREAT